MLFPHDQRGGILHCLLFPCSSGRLGRHCLVSLRPARRDPTLSVISLFQWQTWSSLFGIAETSEAGSYIVCYFLVPVADSRRLGCHCLVSLRPARRDPTLSVISLFQWQTWLSLFGIAETSEAGSYIVCYFLVPVADLVVTVWYR